MVSGYYTVQSFLKPHGHGKDVQSVNENGEHIVFFNGYYLSHNLCFLVLDTS